MSKPTLKRQRKFYQGKYKLKNPEKYVGDKDNVIFRSSWERRCLKFFDEQPNILQFSSEEVEVPYYDPVQGRFRRYFPDFLVQYKNTSGEIINTLIEVKPFDQTIPPRKRRGKRFIYEATTYATNISKWKAAKKYAEDRGWQFRILTEKNI